MPSPIDLLLDPISLAIIGIYLLLIAVEHLWPARPLPRVRFWRSAGIVAFVVYFFVSSYLPILWSEQMAAWQWFDLSGLGTLGGAAVGLLVYELGAYLWHRSMHGSTLLWRGLHQMHHSSERLDSYSAFWFSPLDMAGWTALSSLALTQVVGLTPQATTLVMLTITLLAIFQHSNLRTPRWLGYFVQRPESHSFHHERGVHARNYADLPVFDILFGSFHNPKDFAPATGFHQGASYRIAEMLSFRDVTMPRTKAATGLDQPASKATQRPSADAV